jgi:large subunit ribosomal protein L5
MASRLRKHYEEIVKPDLQNKFGYKNLNLVPKIQKIVVNTVSRDCVVNAKVVELLSQEIRAITGQKPVAARAKASIATFKIRKGQQLGVCVTLRAEKMYDFLDRLVNLSLPRVRDFKGIPRKGFDSNGNYNLGLKEQIIFPEINYDKIDKVRGMSITIVTTAKNSEESYELLKNLGLPFREQ